MMGDVAILVFCHNYIDVTTSCGSYFFLHHDALVFARLPEILVL